MQPFDLDRLLWIVIAAAVAALIGRVTKLIDSASEERKETERHRKEQAKLKEKQNQMQNAASRYLLKDRLLQGCDFFLLEGYCPAENREVIQEMFEIYTALGGNSFMHEKVAAVMKLPVKPREKAKLH